MIGVRNSLGSTTNATMLKRVELPHSNCCWNASNNARLAMAVPYNGNLQCCIIRFSCLPLRRNKIHTHKHQPQQRTIPVENNNKSRRWRDQLYASRIRRYHSHEPMDKKTFSDYSNIGAYLALLLPSLRCTPHLSRSTILRHPICIWPRLANNDVDGLVSCSPLATI